MFRRFLRILCVGGLFVIIATALLGQFATCILYAPKAYIDARASGIQIAASVDSYYSWRAAHGPPDDAWNLHAQAWFPFGFTTHMRGVPGGALLWVLNIPWWFLFVTWSGLTLLVWRLTRRRMPEQAFPVEPIQA